MHVSGCLVCICLSVHITGSDLQACLSVCLTGPDLNTCVCLSVCLSISQVLTCIHVSVYLSVHFTTPDLSQIVIQEERQRGEGRSLRSLGHTHFLRVMPLAPNTLGDNLELGYLQDTQESCW